MEDALHGGVRDRCVDRCVRSVRGLRFNAGRAFSATSASRPNFLTHLTGEWLRSDASSDAAFVFCRFPRPPAASTLCGPDGGRAAETPSPSDSSAARALDRFLGAAGGTSEDPDFA